MGFGFSTLSSSFSRAKEAIESKLNTPQAKGLLRFASGVGSVLGLPLTGILGYHSVKSVSYAGLNCFSEPWRYQTLVKIVSLPQPLRWMPEISATDCKPQIAIAVSSIVLTLVAATVTYKLGAKYLSAPPTRSVPQKPLPLFPPALLLNEVLEEMQSRSDFFATEGLCRLSGLKSAVEAAKEALLKRKEKQILKTLGAHELVGLTKELFLSGELPVIPPAQISEQEYQKEAGLLGNQTEAQRSLLLTYLSQRLSRPQYEVVSLIMNKLLVPTLNRSKVNKMSADNLATTFSRLLFQQPVLPQMNKTAMSPEQLRQLSVDTNAWWFKALLTYFQENPSKQQ